MSMAVGTPITEEEQMMLLAAKESICRQKIAEETINGAYPFHNTDSFCPPIWDGMLCWNKALAGQLVTQFCPFYVFGFTSQANATKYCTKQGTWFSRDGNHSWTNFSQCFNSLDVTFIIDTDVPSGNVSYIEPYLQTLKAICEVGYAISMTSLIVALLIFASIKKLRCPRNVLHMHLFVSFIMRAFMYLLKYSIFEEGLGLTTDLLMGEDGNYFNSEQQQIHWLCRMIVTLWQYFIMANYSWILMEGLYLHSLLFFALFTDSSDIALYISLGWGLPAIFVLSWSILRVLLENTWCWTTNDNTAVFLLIRVPTTASIVVNFILFINIIRLLYHKLKSSTCEETKKYRRWAKSTLVLVPLFGVHYMVFLGLQLSDDKSLEIAWLFCDLLFASFNGFFVALLYCFMNGEVQAELSKKWHKFCDTRLPSWTSISRTKLCRWFLKSSSCAPEKTYNQNQNGHFSNRTCVSVSIIPSAKKSKMKMISKRPSERSLQGYKSYEMAVD